MSRTETGEYRCNWCKANLTRKETSASHMSLTIGAGSGVANDAGPLPGWRIQWSLPVGRFHFCLGTDCLTNWLIVQIAVRQGYPV